MKERQEKIAKKANCLIIFLILSYLIACLVSVLNFLDIFALEIASLRLTAIILMAILMCFYINLFPINLINFKKWSLNLAFAIISIGIVLIVDVTKNAFGFVFVLLILFALAILSVSLHLKTFKSFLEYQISDYDIILIKEYKTQSIAVTSLMLLILSCFSINYHFNIVLIVASSFGYFLCCFGAFKVLFPYKTDKNKPLHFVFCVLSILLSATFSAVSYLLVNLRFLFVSLSVLSLAPFVLFVVKKFLENTKFIS